jgi:signal transduction histidine kinase
MLKNLRVRTKLIAVLAVPLAALIVMAAIGVLDRRAEASEARDGRYLAELTDARVELVHQLQLERTWAGATVASKNAFGVEEAEAQRQATDGAIAAFIAQSGPARGVTLGLDDQIGRVIADIDQLGSVRQSIDDGNVNSQVAVAYYTRVVLGLSDLASITAGAARGTDLQGDLASLTAMGEVKESQASINATVSQILGEGVGRQPQFDAIDSAQTLLDQQQQRFFELASDDARRQQQELDAASDSQTSVILLREVLNIGPGTQIQSVDNTEWIAAATARLDTMRKVEDFITNSVKAQATQIEDEATAAARNFLFGAAGVVLLSLLLASVVARSIARPLGRLTQGAYRLSEEGLPALVEQLRNPEAEGVGDELTPIDIDSRDEIGQLASAFNSIQEVTKSVAGEQATLLRKGIGDIFVNLARRNQTLLDRQIEFIDQLESREEDPDQLENLFKLDHLATRMRRNAESLLVLAGAEPPRRRGRPVDMADVVRVAIGEVEHFARITLLALDEATVSATVAVDLAHLLSELMENATQFSPPESHVEIVGHKTRDGNYVLSVSDQGIGMSAEQLADANRLMANPPVVGLALSRSLGFIVIGRLAARFGIVVRLTASPSGGVSALVSLPNAVIDVQAPPEPVTPTAFEAPDDVSSITGPIEPMDLVPPGLHVPADLAMPEPVGEPASDAGRDRETSLEPVASAAALGLTPIVDEPEPVDESQQAAVSMFDAAFSPETLPAPDTVASEWMLAPETEPESLVTPESEPATGPTPDTLPAAPGDNGYRETGPRENGHGPYSHGLPPLPNRQPGETMLPASPLTPPAPAPTPAPTPAMAPPPPPPPPMPPAPPAPAPVAPAPVPVAGAPLPTRRIAPTAPDSPGGADSTVTAGGLTRRVPKATTPTAGITQSAQVSAPQRSPEEVRLMLSRYRSGLRRGRTDDASEGSQEN